MNDKEVKECINGFYWYRKYAQYRCPDGSIWIDSGPDRWTSQYTKNEPCPENTQTPRVGFVPSGGTGPPGYASAPRAGVGIGEDAVDFTEVARWEPASGRDETVQLFIAVIDSMVVEPAEADSARPWAFVATPSAWWRAITTPLERATERGAALPRARSGNGDHEFWLEPIGQPTGSALGAPNLQAFITSLGRTSGEAFQIRVINDGIRPVKLVGDGVVLEPLKKAAQQRVESRLQQLVRQGRKAANANLNAYCVEFLRRPPPAGMLFRVVERTRQQQFEPMRRILRASRRLEQAGRFTPDSDPVAYFHSITQWALWSVEQNFNLNTFGQAFVEQTKKNLVAGGQPWSKQIEDTIRGLVPHRWEEISTVLREAQR